MNLNYDEIVQKPAWQVHRAFKLMCAGEPDEVVLRTLYPSQADRDRILANQAQKQADEEKATLLALVKAKAAERSAATEERKHALAKFLR